MTLTDKLIKRLNEEHGMNIPADVYVRRTYAGHWQLSAGAWRWHFECQDRDINFRVNVIGSQWTIKELLEAPFLSIYNPQWGDIEIIPEDKEPKDYYSSNDEARI